MRKSCNGAFGQIQQLAYSTSITFLVSPQNYTRANSMNSVVYYGSDIIAPAIAGVLYPIIGLGGILPIDLATFIVAIAILVWIRIPQATRRREGEETGRRGDGSSREIPKFPSPPVLEKVNKLALFWGEVTFGIKYIWQRDGLRTLLIIIALFWFVHDLTEAIYEPMILARSNNNSQVLGKFSPQQGLAVLRGQWC